MDLSFFRRADQRLASRAPAALDFGILVATLRAQRDSMPATSARSAASEPPACCPDPIAEILLAGPSWREAVAAQRGCFNSAFARQDRFSIDPALESSAFLARRSDASPVKSQGAVN
ncbi:MAG TPA: hypothetical protein VF645_01175 [Allosphingosinicella sp.]|jgi:hypothetical protein